MQTTHRLAQALCTLKLFGVLCAIFYLWASTAHWAQAGTTITQTTGAGDLGTTVLPKSGNVVGITNGTLVGNNLFHSFAQFSVGTGDIAQFQTTTLTPNPGLGNILGRVTGGNPSSIFGTIDSATYFPTANFFLLNPNGIILGPNASLNVGGSVTFTTANYLRLADTGIFYANPASTSVLTSAPVAAFGFIGTNPAAISVQGSFLSVQPGQSVSLVGGNHGFSYTDPDTGAIASVPGGVTITGGGLSASSGQINLVSVASAGEVSAADFLPQSGMTMGNVYLSQGATLDVSGDLGGTVRIRGGQFEMDQAYIYAGTGDADSAAIAVSLNVTGDAKIKNQSAIDVSGFGGGRTGDIEIRANNLYLQDGSYIANQGFGSAPSGNISLTIADSLTLEKMDPFGNGSFIQTINSGAGTGGGITMNAAHVSVADHGFILTQAGGQAPAGDITMNVGDLTLGDPVLGTSGSIQTLGTDNASSGNIRITATNSISLIGQGDFNTRIINQNSGPGGTGSITIATGTLALTNGAQLLSETVSIPGSASAPGSKVSITATDSVTVSGGSSIDLTNNASGTSSVGSLDITAQKTIVVADLGLINTSTIGHGDAGAINLMAQNISLVGGGQINSLTQGSAATGQGGAISIVATENLSLSGSAINSFGQLTPTAIHTSSLFGSRGQGGNLSITAGQSVNLSDSASISASSTGTGNAGNININAGQQLMLQNSSITTQASQSSGGNIGIRAVDQVRLVNSKISTSVLGGAGGGGNITIDPNTVVLQNSQILAQAVQGAGGNITITTPLFLADQTSLVSASSQFGLNGTVIIQSPTSNLSGTVASLPSSMRQQQALQAQRCALLAGGESSSFIVAGRDTIPTEPGSWLASPLGLHSLDRGLFAETTIDEQRPTTLVMAQAPETISLRRLTPAGFLTQRFAGNGSDGCRS